MDEWSAEARGATPRRPQRCSLAMGGTHYPIVSEDSTSCLIQAPPGAQAGARMRGYADIYDGERHRAHCLVVLARAEGEFLRVIYKRRTAARSDPPADYAAPARPAPEPAARSKPRRRPWPVGSRGEGRPGRGDRSPS
jgi:hypothetical protein